MNNPRHNVRIDIIKGFGVEHKHLIEYVEYSGSDRIITGEESEIDVGDFLYIEGGSFQVTRLELAGTKRHVYIRKL